MRDLVRTKWAAVGAAVAVTLGAGGVSLTQAAITDGEKPVYVSLDAPCRLVDTRPGTIAAGDAGAYVIQVTGANGNCTGGLAIPADAVGVSTNVTVIQPNAPTTGRSFFTVYPSDATRPVTSNLNFVTGQAPTPNKVDVGLSADGKITIYNNEGTAHAAVDVFGYYIDHGHTGADIVDESLTGADVLDESLTAADVLDESLTGADIKNGTVSNADTSNEPGIASEYRNTVFVATGTPTAVVGTSMRVPSDGQVVVEVSGLWSNVDAGNDIVYCQIQKGATGEIDFAQPFFMLHDRNTNQGYSAFSSHRVMPIAVADNPPFVLFSGQALSLVCDEAAGNVFMDEVLISATFYPTSYEPAGFIFPFSTDAAGVEAGE